MRLHNVQDVVQWRLCVGCGACAYTCPEKNITLSNVLQEGIRPRIEEGRCRKCGECLRSCPGLSMVHASRQRNNGFMAEMMTGWGHIYEVWEGYAADPEIRYHGSSGGLASALALYCLEKGAMHGILHIGPDEDIPFRNKSVFSTDRNEVLARAGSRYSPASPCDSLEKIAEASGPCVFIGKPCDVAAVRQVQFMRKELNDKVGAAIGIFCAGTPSSQATLDLFHQQGIDPETVEEVRYRGKGWPGKFSVKLKGEKRSQEVLTYMDAWGFVQKYRPYRCYLCPDGTSEFADLSCGDPWYRQIKEGEQGYSLVLVRTEKGRRIVHGAVKDGYVNLERVNPEVLLMSQKNLLLKRGAIWGRLLTMKALGIPTPRLSGYSLFRNWLALPSGEKARSIVGTARRIIQRKYYRPQECERDMMKSSRE